MSDRLRCEITANICGTDTWAAGNGCRCRNCVRYREDLIFRMSQEINELREALKVPPSNIGKIKKELQEIHKQYARLLDGAKDFLFEVYRKSNTKQDLDDFNGLVGSHRDAYHEKHLSDERIDIKIAGLEDREWNVIDEEFGTLPEPGDLVVWKISTDTPDAHYPIIIHEGFEYRIELYGCKLNSLPLRAVEWLLLYPARPEGKNS